MTDPDRKLAGRARRGDRRALTVLYDRHRARLLGFLIRTTGSRTVAEDVFQEAWTKVLQNIEGFDPVRGNFRSWLYRIAANAAIDRSRRESIRRGPELDAAVASDGARWIDRVASPEPGPDRAGMSRRLGEALSNALGTLNPGQRAAVLLRHQQGMSYAEIASTLDVAEGTAKSMVSRGVATLRARLVEWTDA